MASFWFCEVQHCSGKGERSISLFILSKIIAQSVTTRSAETASFWRKKVLEKVTELKLKPTISLVVPRPTLACPVS